LASYDNPNNIGFSPGYGGTITVRLPNQTRYSKLIDLGPGNGGATPSLMQHWIYLRGQCATQNFI